MEENRLTIDLELQPYLNAEYWDGHNMADECKDISSPSSDISLRGCHRFAVQTLKKHLMGGNPAFPLETYNRGQTFNPNGHEAGTVLIFDTERMYTTHKQDITEQLEPFQEQPLPLRPTDLPVSVRLDMGQNSTFLDSKELGLHYSRTVRWGVVTPTKTGPNVIMHTNASMAGLSYNGKPRVFGGVLPQVTPVDVGETKHWSRYGNNFLRTNLLKVCAYGMPETQRKPKRSLFFLGRLATDNA